MHEKYAVVIDDEQEKVASQKGRPCPSCGSLTVNYNGLTPHCKTCGTEPWEKKVHGASKDLRDFRR